MLHLFSANIICAQDMAKRPEPDNDCRGYWNGNKLDCTLLTGACCIRPEKLRPKFDLQGFDELIASEVYEKILEFSNTNKLDEALGGSAKKKQWVIILAGLKKGNLTLVKIKEVKGYNYLVAKTIVGKDKYIRATNNYVGHVTLLK